MQVKNHLLLNRNGSSVNFKATPNKGGKYIPEYLVIHYTAATTTESSVNWFSNRIAQASAHLLIGRDGRITQFAPFDVVTWHAGKSQWKGLSGLNKHAIGIELVNGGRLIKSGDNSICPVDQKRIPDEEVIKAVHKNEQKESLWHEYTELQLRSAIQVAALLVKTYGLKDVIGHDDISPIRKSDPGPGFPMGSFRSRAMGRRNDRLDEFVTSEVLNIRSGPGSGFPTLTEALPPETPVLVLRTEGTWSFVEVLTTVHGIMDLEGWVSTKYLAES
jgi:N-acetylmuramoyl-L-alanine amidase